MFGARGGVAVVCLLALALPLHHRVAEAAPGDSTKEKKTQQETCHDQCKETPGNNPYSSNYPCPLLNQLHYYTTCGCVERPDAPGTFGFSVSEQTLILNWISQMEIVLEGFGGDINDTCIVEISLALQGFFDANPSIALAIGVQSVNSSSGVFFGTFNDFCNLHISIQFEVVSPCLARDSAGHCPLTKAIMAAAQASGNAQIISECQNLTVHIEHLLEQTSFNLTEQLSFIYQLIIQECSTTTIAFLNSQCSISGFGSFQSIFDMCKVNFRVQTMNSYMSGTDQTNCPFLMDLKTTWNATCFGPPGTGNNTVCSTLKSLIDQITVEFSSNSGDIEVLMVDCSNIIWEMCKAAQWICDIHLTIGGCSLSDFVFCSAFCHNEDCCDWNSPPPKLPECSCEEGESSSGGSGSGSVSRESPTPGSGSLSESGSGSASKESPTPGSGSLSESGSGSASKESPTPGSGSLSASGSGSASKESPTPASSSGSGSGSGSESGETTPAVSTPAPSTPAATTPAVTTPAATTPAVTTAAATTKAATTPAATTPAVTTAAATTKAATTVAATTKAATTPAATTVTPTPTVSHCDARQSLLLVVTSCNCSSFFLSITKVTNTWSSITGQKTSVQPTINKIQQILYSSESLAQKFLDIWNAITAWTPSNSSWKTQFLSITIYYSDMTTVWGTVGDFMNCGSTCGCSG